MTNTKRRSRRKFMVEFKAKVAMEALQEKLTLTELSKKCDVRPNLITNWKTQLLEAMVYGDFCKKSSYEKKITDKVNEANIGPLGLGGKHSVLATFAKVGSQRASGVRIVALRLRCCFEPRRACVEL